MQSVEQRLEQAGLLLKYDQVGERREWDTHPLIRRYFGQALQKQHPEAYRQAQLVLFEYYQSVPDKKQPDTVEELDPLYRAVVHGCLAGKYQKALKYVYEDRIMRGDEHYSHHKLGAYAQNLTANFHRHQQNIKESQKDLDASLDIIHRSGMKLYQVDALLLQANLNLEQGKMADEEYKLAKALIAETGYHLRDGELEGCLNRIEVGVPKLSLWNRP